MYTLKTESTVSKLKQVDNIPMNDYETGIALIDQLVTNYQQQVAKIATETLNANYMMASKERLKQVIKQALKDQNTEFVGKLADFMVSVRKKQIGEVSRELKPLETYFNATGEYNEAVARLTDKGYTKDEAISWLKSKGYNENSTDIIIDLPTKNSGEKEPFDWNKVLDTTGKVAQSLFFFGNMFSKKEDPTPTLTDATQKTDVDKRKMIRNIVIVAVVLIGLGVGAYFVFRKK